MGQGSKEQLMAYGEELILIHHEKEENEKKYFVIKRIFDIFASALGLILLSPLFLIVSIAIKVNDPRGKVFYNQTRIGKLEKSFKMYKFRSMYSDADERLCELLEDSDVDGPMFKMKNDPRITPVGKFIRRYSIDELPQLLNVLKGDMSLVGPRPPLPREVVSYSDCAKQRLLVKPGCTGWWQVNERNNVGFDGMLKRDFEYIEKQSILFDLKILFMTVKVIFFPNEAY